MNRCGGRSSRAGRTDLARTSARRSPAPQGKRPAGSSRPKRAAIEGLLAQLKPSLAIEIGTAEGGSLECIAAYSGHVHTLDLAPGVTDAPANVTLHVGDSKEVLPRLLRELEQDGQNVDFVLVDGAHEAEGVERDVRSLLASNAVSRTVIVLHDTANEAVR